MSEYNYESELFIDKYNLDVECIDQPRRFKNYGDLWAEAIADRDRAKQKVKVTRADIERMVRKDPLSFGVEKITEASVSSTVELHEDVQRAEISFIEAAREVNLLSIAKEAFQDRREEIRNLVGLFQSSYWAMPKIKSEEMPPSTSLRPRNKRIERAVDDKIKEMYKE